MQHQWDLYTLLPILVFLYFIDNLKTNHDAYIPHMRVSTWTLRVGSSRYFAESSFFFLGGGGGGGGWRYFAGSWGKSNPLFMIILIKILEEMKE